MEPFLSPSDLELIRRWDLSSRRRMSGLATGEQRSPALGGGIEFVDYRDYVPGDDIRLVDWTAYRRLQRLLVKRTAEERERTLLLLVDTSESMAFGSPSKLDTARRVAALLGGIALRSGNRAGLLSWGRELNVILPPQRGQRMVPTFADQAERLTAEGEGRPLDCARALATRYHRQCIAVLLSDLLHDDTDEVLAGLAASGNEVYVLHLLAPQEFQPEGGGEVTLVDSEGQGEVSLLLDAPLLDEYHRRWGEWLDQVGARARSVGLSYLVLRSDADRVRLIEHDLRSAGLVC